MVGDVESQSKELYGVVFFLVKNAHKVFGIQEIEKGWFFLFLFLFLFFFIFLFIYLFLLFVFLV